MAPPVTIRNISNNALTLVLVEHFDPPQQEGSGLGLGFLQMHNVTRTLATVTNSIGLTNNTTRKAVPQIQPDARPFSRREVSIALPPFTLVPTDIKPVIQRPSERLRLTIQTEQGERHQMYCPVPTAETESLVALASHPQMRFTGIFLPDTSFVALFNTSRLDAWMQEIPDHAPLGALSIPGTHNSPTCHSAPPSVRCQAVSPTEQLHNGVRFFDVRVQVPEPYDVQADRLNLVHAAFPIALAGNKPFRALYHDMLQFLIDHPSETLILSLKREGTGKGTDEQLSRILHTHYATNHPQHWFTEPRVPTLSEARGRIVLLRRFELDEPLRHEWGGRGWGIDAHVWEDNTAHATCPSGDVCVQDFYQVMERPSIEKKIDYARDHLERSGACDFHSVSSNNNNINTPSKKYPLYINFLSASNFWNVGTWPEKIAAQVNPAVTAHLGRKHMLDDQGRVKDGNWSTGVVVTDWVGLGGDWDLVRAIVGMNSKISRQ